jgi:hypothetical protein
MCKEIVHSVRPILSKAVKDVVNVSTRKSNMLDEQSGSLIFTSPKNINIKEFTQGPDGKFLLIATGSNRNASDVDAGSSISNSIPYLTVSNIGEGSVKGEHLILPIPGEDVMNASNSIGIPDMDSLVASMKGVDWVISISGPIKIISHDGSICMLLITQSTRRLINLRTHANRTTATNPCRAD